MPDSTGLMVTLLLLAWFPFCYSLPQTACPPNCAYDECDKQGLCNHGCKLGWWGPTCDQECINKENCLYEPTCFQINGTCSHGCKLGYYGAYCDQLCSQHCRVSLFLFWVVWWMHSLCWKWPHSFVSQYEPNCNRWSGKCTYGCNGGWYGPKCDIPEPCAKPPGDDCTWYSKCLANFTTSCPFVNDVMYTKCETYKKLESSLSSQGQKWSNYVRNCLQQTLAKDIVDSPGPLDCQNATSEFFDGHLPCYLDGDISFCNLELGDQSEIIWNAQSIFWRWVKCLPFLLSNCSLNWLFKTSCSCSPSLSSKKIWQATKSGAKLFSACNSRFWEFQVQKVKNGAEKVIEDSVDALFSSLFRPFNWNSYTVWTTSLQEKTKPYREDTSDPTFVLSFGPVTGQEPSLNITEAVAIKALQQWNLNSTNTPYQIVFNGQNITEGLWWKKAVAGQGYP